MCVNLFYVQITLLIPYEVTRCLKITEKVLFNIASEASYAYILSGPKFLENAKNGQFGDFFEKMRHFW